MAMGGFGPSSVIESNPIFFITQKYILQIANRQTIWRFSSEHYSLEDAVQHAFLLLNFDPAMILRVVDNQTLDVEWAMLEMPLPRVIFICSIFVNHVTSKSLVGIS